jgi:hypothetical protein
MTGPFADAALELAAAGWEVFPLGKRSKMPAIKKHEGGNGFHGGTTDARQVAAWVRRYPDGNIGAAVPASLFVVDVDGAAGRQSLHELEAEHEPLPPTLTVRTPRADRGEHRYFLVPSGPIAGAKLAAGLDLRLPGRHYTVLPPSIHPDTGRPYEWVDVTVSPTWPPPWLVAALRPPPRFVSTRPPIRGQGDRPGDVLEASLTWREILEPCGWVWVRSHGTIDYWRRPGKDYGISATVNGRGTGRLHVFSSGAAPLEPDTSYSKFGALTALEFGGDFRAAARALRQEGVST